MSIYMHINFIKVSTLFENVFWNGLFMGQFKYCVNIFFLYINIPCVHLGGRFD